VHEPARTGDIKFSLANIEKAKKILGYTGRVKFAQGLERTIAWYKESL
jgi:UDP-N-acetylglucosamine/UDP-N-acetylgalactosamine 4-epimerase